MCVCVCVYRHKLRTWLDYTITSTTATARQQQPKILYRDHEDPFFKGWQAPVGREQGRGKSLCLVLQSHVNVRCLHFRHYYCTRLEFDTSLVAFRNGVSEAFHGLTNFRLKRRKKKINCEGPANQSQFSQGGNCFLIEKFGTHTFNSALRMGFQFQPEQHSAVVEWLNFPTPPPWLYLEAWVANKADGKRLRGFKFRKIQFVFSDGIKWKAFVYLTLFSHWWVEKPISEMERRYNFHNSCFFT